MIAKQNRLHSEIPSIKTRPADSVRFADSTHSDIPGNRLPRYAVALVGIAVLDLVSTLAFARFLNAGEANPLLGWALERGPLIFTVVKLLFVVPPVAVLVWASKRRPRFTRAAGWTAMGAYAAIYGLGVVKANLPAQRAFGKSERLLKSETVWTEICESIQSKRQTPRRIKTLPKSAGELTL